MKKLTRAPLKRASIFMLSITLHVILKARTFDLGDTTFYRKTFLYNGNYIFIFQVALARK